MPIEDLAAWHEYWITIQASEGDGTHTVNIYTDGSTEASTFEVTVGSAARFEDFCICPSFTTGATAVDIDFIAYSNGVLAPASGGATTGDFDGDGDLDHDDVNALIGEMNGAMSGAFDVTGDGAVNVDDLNNWVVALKKTWIGDANLDGEFNSGDFVEVFQAGKFELDTPASWNEGDWNGDGRFNSGDFVAAFQDGGFELGPRQAVQSVPEPSGICLPLIGGLILCSNLRCRRKLTDTLGPRDRSIG